MDSKGELQVCETLENEKIRSPDGVFKNPMLDKNYVKSISKTSLKHLKFVSLTNDAVILSRSRAKNQAKSTLHRQLPPHKGQESSADTSSATQDSRQLFNNLYIRESKKNLHDQMKHYGMVVSSALGGTNHQVSLKNLLIEQRQLSKSTLEDTTEKGIYSSKRPHGNQIRLASNESERELAKQILKQQAPQRIKIVDTHARFLSQPRAIKLTGNVFPITIRNFSNESHQKDEYAETDEVPALTDNKRRKKRPSKIGGPQRIEHKPQLKSPNISVQDHQLVALEPPKIEN